MQLPDFWLVGAVGVVVASDGAGGCWLHLFWRGGSMVVHGYSWQELILIIYSYRSMIQRKTMRVNVRDCK